MALAAGNQRRSLATVAVDAAPGSSTATSCRAWRDMRHERGCASGTVGQRSLRANGAACRPHPAITTLLGRDEGLYADAPLFQGEV